MLPDVESYNDDPAPPNEDDVVNFSGACDKIPGSSIEQFAATSSLCNSSTSVPEIDEQTVDDKASRNALNSSSSLKTRHAFSGN